MGKNRKLVNASVNTSRKSYEMEKKMEFRQNRQ